MNEPGPITRISDAIAGEMKLAAGQRRVLHAAASTLDGQPGLSSITDLHPMMRTVLYACTLRNDQVNLSHGFGNDEVPAEARVLAIALSVVEQANAASEGATVVPIDSHRQLAGNGLAAGAAR